MDVWYDKLNETLQQGEQTYTIDHSEFKDKLAEFYVEQVFKGYTMSATCLSLPDSWPGLGIILDIIENSKKLTGRMERANKVIQQIIKDDFFEAIKDVKRDPTKKDLVFTLERALKLIEKKALDTNLIIHYYTPFQKTLWDKPYILKLDEQGYAIPPDGIVSPREKYDSSNREKL